MGLMMSEGKFVGRDEIAMVPTPAATASWKPAPVFVTELVKARTIRQQVGGTVQDAPPHRFRELFPAGTLKPRARIILDGPEPVAERKITRIDLFFKGPVTRQQPTPHSRMIRYFAVM